MRFKLRTFLIIFSLVGVGCGWFGSRYIQSKKEQQILADLSPGMNSYFIVRTLAVDDDLSERYSSDRLFALANKYSKIAESEPSESTSARIAAAALCHVAARYDMRLKKFICEPKAIKLAEKYFDSKAEPLASVATMVLLRHHRFSDDVHASQDCRSGFEDGFDADDPFDVYVLVTEVFSEFNYGNEAYGIEEDWPAPRHPWDWSLEESAAHTYDDKVEALEQVSPEAADAYAAIISELRKCNAKPSNAQRQKLHELSQELMLALDEPSIFRFMLKNKDLFKTNSGLILDLFQDSRATSDSQPKPAEKINR